MRISVHSAAKTSVKLGTDGSLCSILSQNCAVGLSWVWCRTLKFTFIFGVCAQEQCHAGTSLCHLGPVKMATKKAYKDVLANCVLLWQHFGEKPYSDVVVGCLWL